MRNKKISVIVLIVLVVLAVLITGAKHLWEEFSDYSTCLAANWHLSLPSDAHYTEIFQKDEGASFHGDGIRYHVFSYENAQPMEQMIQWQDKTGDTKNSGSYADAADKWLDQIDVPEDQRPNYADCVFGYQIQDDSSQMLLFLDKAQSKLYILEFFL